MAINLYSQYKTYCDIKKNNKLHTTVGVNLKIKSNKYYNKQTTPILTIIVDDAERLYGDENPKYTYKISGFLDNDNSNMLEILPVLDCNTNLMSPVGQYSIIASGAKSDKYGMLYSNGVLTIKKSKLKIIAEDKSREKNTTNPEFTYLLEGFKNSDTRDSIDKLPILTTNAKFDSAEGEYEIVASGAEDNNYEFIYENAKLLISDDNLVLYPNPTSSILNVYYLKSSIKKLSIIDVHGSIILKKRNVQNKFTIDVSGLSKAVYFIKIIDNNGSITTKRFIVK
jgi:hypothetical protein